MSKKLTAKTNRESKFAVLIELPARYKTLIDALAARENRKRKQQAEIIVIRALESAEAVETAAA